MLARAGRPDAEIAETFGAPCLFEFCLVLRRNVTGEADGLGAGQGFGKPQRLDVEAPFVARDILAGIEQPDTAAQLLQIVVQALDNDQLLLFGLIQEVFLRALPAGVLDHLA